MSITGWFVLLLFHISSLHRSEVARKKDKLVADVEKLLDWGCSSENHRQLCAEVKETIFSSKITLIERRSKSLFIDDFGWNNELKESMAKIRDFDIVDTDTEETRNNFQAKMHIACDEVFEKIESCYEDYCKKRTWVSKVYVFRKYKDTLLGAASAAITLFLLFSIFLDWFGF
jgi:hypothetical protein